jgi:Na+-translocating ferredoxin:NAD+ oxidoreductase subunit B
VSISYSRDTGKAPQDGLISRIHAALPQTQCTRCGYADCAGYAEAIALDTAAINQCPPGGAEGVRRLAAITGKQVLALNPVNGQEGARAVAVIDEAWCIGCTLCLDVCPTDAIIGSNKLMHTVIETCCTGCELCIPVCPVDCIGLDKVSPDRTGWDAWSQLQADIALNRYESHRARRAGSGGRHRTDSPEPHKQDGSAEAAMPTSNAPQPDRKRAVIEAALAQARAARLNKGGTE